MTQPVNVHASAMAGFRSLEGAAGIEHAQPQAHVPTHANSMTVANVTAVPVSQAQQVQNVKGLNPSSSLLNLNFNRQAQSPFAPPRLGVITPNPRLNRLNFSFSQRNLPGVGAPQQGNNDQQQ